MNELVFIDPQKMDSEPFTTSKVIAEQSGVGHKKVKEAITKHRAVIQTFGLLALYETESTGGRPETIYRLTEPQAAFLMTLLKNTPFVVEFKRRLVEAFYAMRKELLRRHIETASRRPIRKEMKNAIRDCLPESEHKDMYYVHFTNLAYRLAFGMNAAQLRKERNAPRKANASEYMTSGEIAQAAKFENIISAMIEAGMTYEEIKASLNKKLAFSKRGA